MKKILLMSCVLALSACAGDDHSVFLPDSYFEDEFLNVAQLQIGKWYAVDRFTEPQNKNGPVNAPYRMFAIAHKSETIVGQNFIEAQRHLRNENALYLEYECSSDSYGKDESINIHFSNTKTRAVFFAYDDNDYSSATFLKEQNRTAVAAIMKKARHSKETYPEVIDVFTKAIDRIRIIDKGLGEFEITAEGFYDKYAAIQQVCSENK